MAYGNTEVIDSAAFKSLVLPIMTTTDINNLSGALGMIVYDSTIKRIKIYDASGAGWEIVKAGGMV